MITVAGRYYYVQPIPKQFSGLGISCDGQPIQQARVALRPYSLIEAKAAAVNAATLAGLKTLVTGGETSAHARYLGLGPINFVEVFKRV